MLNKKINCLFAVFGLATTLFAHAEIGNNATFFPPSGTYLDAQAFDMTFSMPTINPYANPQVLGVFALLDGKDVSGWFKQCFQPTLQIPMLPPSAGGGNSTLLCKRQAGAGFGVGTHTLTAEVRMADGSVSRGSATYSIIKTPNNPTLPMTFMHPGSSASYASSVQVQMGQQVKISANGRMSTWAANPDFPVATPKGTLTCNASTCLIPGGYTGALLVKIGATGPWTVVGENRILVADRSGELFFAVNDKNFAESWLDNVGAYEVTISR